MNSTPVLFLRAVEMQGMGWEHLVRQNEAIGRDDRRLKPVIENSKKPQQAMKPDYQSQITHAQS